MAMIAAAVGRLSESWHGVDAILYLDRCQVDTPDALVEATWRRVLERRADVGRVIDFGAGDGRFGCRRRYTSYTGYELDLERCRDVRLPEGAELLHACAFASDVADADLCIGNPPFVRNQDLPSGWRELVARRLEERSGIRLSGLANAWQYFFLLSLVATADDGLCALVIPYEWVSRPSAAGIRAFIEAAGWEVDVYRMSDNAFPSVMTTASITLVDKAAKSGRWRFFEEDGQGVERLIASPSGALQGHLAYAGRRLRAGRPRAVRGLSPGTQAALVLTEGERCRLGLKPHEDVVRCVTSLRSLPDNVKTLDVEAFDTHFRKAGRRCWLIRTDTPPGPGLDAYLRAVPECAHQTRTCLERKDWWRFQMPPVPAALIATCFKSGSPKAVINSVRAIAVGGVAGIHGARRDWTTRFLQHLGGLDLSDRIVSHAKELKKIEIGQLNTLLEDFDSACDGE